VTADEALAEAHRASYGRLVGWLFRYTGDLQLAEDAVGGAFESALTSWREAGVPDSPEAWLRVAARNRALSALRVSSRSTPVAPETFDEHEAPEPASVIDDRLALLFVCTHPAIDERMHAPLMLQVVLGVDAARIASVFLVSPATMGQRLSRAKAKIRDAGIRYRVPTDEERRVRVASVLRAVYAAYGMADPTTEVAVERDDALRAEAIRLARLLTALVPRDAEAAGLLALLLHTEARRGARVVDGVFVPLAEQDTSRWSGDLLREANEVLAHAEAGDLVHANALLEGVAGDAIDTHAPRWLARARIAELGGSPDEAARAASLALGLTSNPAVRAYLLRRWSLA
jgi:RNA polymerase sigma-70 factor (ECF subfamily)